MRIYSSALVLLPASPSIRPRSLSAGDANTIYFGNLTVGVTADQLRAFAAKAGAVSEITLADNGRFGHVVYRDENGARNAVATLNDLDLQGRLVRVEASRPPSE